MNPIEPNPNLKKYVKNAIHADCSLCWTCSSCDFECPVNRATGRLWPQKILRMTNLGLIEELIQMPEIWYCQTCRRCSQICPNGVQPDKVIGFAREEALRLWGWSFRERFSNTTHCLPPFSGCVGRRRLSVSMRTWNRSVTVNGTGGLKTR